MRSLIGSGVVLLALAAGCSSQAPEPQPAPPGGSTSSAAPAPDGTPSDATSATAEPANPGCPEGRYSITGITGRGSASYLGTGKGGSGIMTFADGNFTVGSDGPDPMKLDVGLGTAELRLDGTIVGTYSVSGDTIIMKAGTSNGSVTISGAGADRQFKLQRVADQLFPGGDGGTVTCTGDTAVLEQKNITVRLSR